MPKLRAEGQIKLATVRTSGLFGARVVARGISHQKYVFCVTGSDMPIM